MLVTNDIDASKARVPVNIEGLIAAALTVRPSALMMGVAEVGKPATSNLVVQAGRRSGLSPSVRATSGFRPKCRQRQSPTTLFRDVSRQRCKDSSRQNQHNNSHRDRSCRRRRRRGWRVGGSGGGDGDEGPGRPQDIQGTRDRIACAHERSTDSQSVPETWTDSESVLQSGESAAGVGSYNPNFRILSVADRDRASRFSGFATCSAG